MQKIAELDKNVSQFFDDHHDPATIEQIFGSSLSQLIRLLNLLYLKGIKMAQP